MSLRIKEKEFKWGERTYIMGVLNLSPDSFSGDGVRDIDEAVERAIEIEEEGADIIDIGGQSTRPGYKEISIEEEVERVIPAVERIAQRVKIPISIDTYRAEVAERAVEVGANIINDVWGLKKDERLALIASRRKIPLIITHNQKGAKYRNIISDISESLKESIRKALLAGLPEELIIIDPGIGFGKTLRQNLYILSRLDAFKVLGKPLLVGTSRKLVPSEEEKEIPPDRRLEETSATVAISIAKGADIIRVHDVRFMRRVARMCDAVLRWR